MLAFPCSVILRFETGNTFNLHIEAEEKTVNKTKGRPFFLFFCLFVFSITNGQQTCLDRCLPLSVPVSVPSLLIHFICSVQYLHLSLEALHIDHLLRSLLNLLLAPFL